MGKTEWDVISEHGKRLKQLEDRLDLLEDCLKFFSDRIMVLEIEMEYFKENYLYLMNVIRVNEKGDEEVLVTPREEVDS